MVNINDCSGVVRVHVVLLCACSCCVVLCVFTCLVVRVHVLLCVFMLLWCACMFTVHVKTYYIYALGGGAYTTG